MAKPRLQNSSQTLIHHYRLLERELIDKTKALDQLLDLVDRIRKDWKKSTERCKLIEKNWQFERLNRKRLEKENLQLREKLNDFKMQSPRARSRKRSLEARTDGESDLMDDSKITKRRALAEELSTVREDTDEYESELENIPSNLIIPETPVPGPCNEESYPQSSLNATFDSFSTAIVDDEESQQHLSMLFDSARSKIRRSSSVPNLLQHEQSLSASRVTIARTSSLKDGSSSDSNSADLFGHRTHEMTGKRNFMTIDCAHCRKGIRFGTMCCKCKNCKLMFHENCKRLTTITCLPRRETPRKNATKGRARLGDFCPDSHPMVPYLIGHCVIQLEKSAVTSSIYLKDGDEDMIEKLLETFKTAKTIPELSDCPPEVVAGCVKKFLNDIRDPLIPLTYRKEFCVATKFNDASELIECIKNLPTCHSNTLVALCIHWQRLAECNENENTNGKLAETLGPIVYGSKRCGSKIQEDLESQLICSLQKILEIPSDQLRELVNCNYTQVLGTPVSRTPSNRSTVTIRSDTGNSKITPLSRN
ncbi:hypothetical protein M3Y98_01108300 [Aphelenchoides besseyi]|nr:hypothetical protein M3Y98_01108300 [Aphelenchoides besseyi]KAI6209242.1 hypothetical protein M3Y96_00200800 [Aphelenchoides besseyi]